MWQVLEALGLHLVPETIVALSRYKPGHGVDTIGLALGFHDLGMRIDFRCEGTTAADKALAEEAKTKMMAILPPLDLKSLLALPAFPIIAYDTFDGMGHVSVVTKLTENNVVVALEEIPVQAITTLEERRRHSLMESISVYHC